MSATSPPAPPASAGESASERIEAVAERLVTLRARVKALAGRAQEAQQRAQDLRDFPANGCQHAAEVAEMQAMLDAVEHELSGLRTAMQTRGVIEQAKGMLMHEQRCKAEEAFSVLVRLSQTSHRKLVDVAESLVATWSKPADA
ncbi:MAG TPA: ANTAR domain-containing protein [Mycobacteriales bacterium]|nr:ANTAR domain-containing protein [Mycobacteriales bacterium]